MVELENTKLEQLKVVLKEFAQHSLKIRLYKRGMLSSHTNSKKWELKINEDCISFLSRADKLIVDTKNVTVTQMNYGVMTEFYIHNDCKELLTVIVIYT